MSQLVDRLTPENARVDLLTSQAEEVRAALSWPSLQHDVEPWFNVAYSHADIPPHILASWRRPDGALLPCPALRLPPPREASPRHLGSALCHRFVSVRERSYGW